MTCYGKVIPYSTNDIANLLFKGHIYHSYVLNFIVTESKQYEYMIINKHLFLQENVKCSMSYIKLS